jgi:tetratricopeptide (TPR) repeat protein
MGPPADEAVAAALARRLARAQALRRSGDALAAAAEYEALVAADPRQPEAWYALASLAWGSGRFRLAVQNARFAAIAIHESGQWARLADVAQLLLDLGETPLALRAIREANLADPVVLGQADRLAACLGQGDSHADALRLLDRALSANPASPALAYLQATTLRHLGRTGEAGEAYERCLALAPAHPGALLMLATQARTNDIPRQLARVVHALDGAPVEAARPLLEYARFTLLDRAGDTGAAWEALMRGAASKRRQVHWDAAREDARIDAIQALCRPPFVTAAPAPARGDAHVPLFITGMPRTGTTVLERILGNHAEVSSAGELNDFHLQLSWQADIASDERASPALLQACRTLDFAAVGRGYLQRTGWRTNGRRFLIDKFPPNFLYAGLIHKALPQARILCLVRNPLDTCLSNLRELFAGGHYAYSYDPLETAAEIVRFHRLVRHWQDVLPGIVLAVRYEELVREPERVARAVMAHCGLPWQPGCTDLPANATPSATASSTQVRQPLHARNIGAWRRYEAPLAAARTFLEARLPSESW